MDFNDIADMVNQGPIKPQNKQLAFMQRAIGTMHHVLFPSVSWRQVVKLCEKELGYENRVSWDWYLQHAIIHGESLDVAFIRDDNQWNLSIKDLLYTPLNRLSIFKLWKDEQPAEVGLIFPIVNREAIIRHLDSLEEIKDAIVKFYDGEYYCIEPLKNFTEHYYGGFNFIMEGNDGE